jgi:hypothetical protein
MNPDSVRRQRKERAKHIRMRDRMYCSQSKKSKRLWRFLCKRYPASSFVNAKYAEYNSNFGFCCSPRASWEEFVEYTCKHGKVVGDVGGHFLLSYAHLVAADGKFTEEQKTERRSLTSLWSCNKAYTTYVVIKKEVYNNVQNGASSK